MSRSVKVTRELLRKSRFGFMLTKARVSKGWTLQEVAEELGVNRVQINNMELGKSATSAFRLWPLCQLLDLDPGKVIKAIYDDWNDGMRLGQ